MTDLERAREFLKSNWAYSQGMSKDALAAKLADELARVREEYEGPLNYLVSAADSLLEANQEEIECRGDEDCDHCVFVNALEGVRALQKGKPNG